MEVLAGSEAAPVYPESGADHRKGYKQIANCQKQEAQPDCNLQTKAPIRRLVPAAVKSIVLVAAAVTAPAQTQTYTHTLPHTLRKLDQKAPWH